MITLEFRARVVRVEYTLALLWVEYYLPMLRNLRLTRLVQDYFVMSPVLWNDRTDA